MRQRSSRCPAGGVGSRALVRILLVGAPLGAGTATIQGHEVCDSDESELGGRVSDASTGVTLPGVEVAVSWNDRDGEARRGLATSGLDGGFTLCLPEDATAVRARAALGPMQGPAVDIAWPTTEAVELTLGLQSDDPSDPGSIIAGTDAVEGDRGAGIRGRVWDSAADRPVPGARIDLDGGDRTALTDATGSSR